MHQNVQWIHIMFAGWNICQAHRWPLTTICGGFLETVTLKQQTLIGPAQQGQRSCWIPQESQPVRRIWHTTVTHSICLLLHTPRDHNEARSLPQLSATFESYFKGVCAPRGTTFAGKSKITPVVNPAVTFQCL